MPGLSPPDIPGVPGLSPPTPPVSLVVLERGTRLDLCDNPPRYPYRCLGVGIRVAEGWTAQLVQELDKAKNNGKKEGRMEDDEKQQDGRQQ